MIDFSVLVLHRGQKIPSEMEVTTAYTVDTFDTVDLAYTIYTIDMVYTVHMTGQTGQIKLTLKLDFPGNL